MRRPLFIVLLAGGLLVGCSDQPTEVPDVPAVPAPSLDVGPTACSLNNLLDLTKALFPPSTTLNLVVATLKALPTNPQLRLAAAIRATVFGIVDLVTKAYTAGKLAGGTTEPTRANLLTFINGLYCFVGLQAPNIPAGALDPNEGAIVVVTPTSGQTLVQPKSKHGGISIPARSVPTTTTITLSRLPNSPFPLFTSLDQYPLFYEFHSSPEVTFTNAVLTGVCLGDQAFSPQVPRLAHNVGPNFGDVELLPPPPVGTGLPVSCTDITTLSSRWGGMRGIFASAFLPTELHASTVALATTGVGGTTKRFSPFGAVDAASNPGSLTIKDGVPQTKEVAAGEGTVSPSPAVVVRSKNGSPIFNVPVTFTVSGGGTVNGTTTQTVLTDNTGLATATNWVPGTAAGSYSLTATPPALAQVGSVEPYKPAVAFAPASLTFTATVPGEIGYGASGYRFKVFATGAPPAGFEAEGFDDSSWGTDDAGFGFYDSVNDCGLILSDTRSPWPVNSQIVLRKRFTVGSSTATVSVAIDNDIKVFVNGVDITGTAVKENNVAPPFVGGFAQHDGCPSRGSLRFVKANLNSGVNLLVMQALDRGGSTFIDAEVTPVTTPPAGTF